MSKLSALAALGNRIGPERLAKYSHAAHLVVGAIGAVRNAQGAYHTAPEEWRGLGTEGRSKYRNAYGKNGYKVFRTKRAISAAASGGIRWYENSKLASDLATEGYHQYKQAKVESAYNKRKPWMKNRPETGPFLHAREHHEGIAKRTIKFVKANALHAVKEHAKGAAIGAVAEHGISNLYGEVVKHIKMNPPRKHVKLIPPKIIAPAKKAAKKKK
jgi:hypothetical protein